MTSVTDYFTDNNTDNMYGETFYGCHTAQIDLKSSSDGLTALNKTTLLIKPLDS
jgi:hypothetical protein